MIININISKLKTVIKNIASLFALGALLTGCGTNANLSGLSVGLNVAQKGVAAGLTLAGGTNSVTVGATYSNGTNSLGVAGTIPTN